MDEVGPTKTEAWHMLQCFYSLRVETRTGLRHSGGSVMRLIKERYGIQGNTKQVVLDNFETYLKEMGVL